VVAAFLVIAMAVSPAWAVVINIGTFDGYQDAPQFATPVGSMTLFLRHSNGKVYRAETNSRGVGQVDLPPGTITQCQAYSEDQLVESWACNIPVGKKAIRLALKNAQTQTRDETPLAIDSRPRAVTAVANKDGSLAFLGYNPLLHAYFITALYLNPLYAILLTNTWSITHEYLMAQIVQTVLTYWVLIVIARAAAETAGGNPGQGDAGGTQ
jgi:hypothetical protein